MPPLVFVTAEGLIMSDNKPPEVEALVEEPLHVIAQREAEKQSTKVKEAQ